MWRTNNSMLLGDVLSVTTAIRTLMRGGASFEVVPEKMAGRLALRGRNVMRFGSVADSREVSLDLEGTPYFVRYDPALLEFVIAGRPGSVSAGKSYVSKRGPDGYIYGLLTVMPTEGAPARRTVIASGVTSGSTQAAQEFFASADRLRDLKRRFQTQGLPGFPPSYQVIVKCVVDNSVLVSYEYESHAVFPGKRR
jgi:hypothetical protein